MAQTQDISPQAMQEMEERLDQYFVDLARPGRVQEIKDKLDKGQSLTQTDGVFALWWFQESLDLDFLRHALHPDVQYVAKHWLIKGVDGVVEHIARVYKPRPPVDKFQPPLRQFAHVVVPKFVDGKVTPPILTALGYPMNKHGAHGHLNVTVKPLDPNNPHSPARIVGLFMSHFFDHWGAEAWVAVRLHLSPSAAGSPRDLLAVSVSGTALDGTPWQVHAPVLQLPALDATALQALPLDELAHNRLEELAFAKASEQLRHMAHDGDQGATQRALDALEKRFGQHPWLSAKIAQLRFMAQEDTMLMAKEVRYSMMRMSSRLASKSEMAYADDETHVSESVMPSFLRKKVSEGKGKVR